MKDGSPFAAGRLRRLEWGVVLAAALFAVMGAVAALAIGGVLVAVRLVEALDDPYIGT